MKATRKILLINAISASAVFATPAFTGGLADAIAEESPVAVQVSPAENAIPGWVAPAVGLLLLGALIGSNGGGGGSSTSSDTGAGSPPPSSGGVK